MTMNLHAWDHPGHMTTAAIAFKEIEKKRPELIEKLGLLMMKQPDPARFWVAAEDARGKERTRRMFIEGARWPDDVRGTPQDRPAWHSARWAIVTDDAPPEARKLAEARGGKPTGQAIEALTLNAAALGNHVWSFAGGSNRPDVNSSFIQPFVAYTWPSAWTVSLQSETTYN